MRGVGQTGAGFLENISENAVVGTVIALSHKTHLHLVSSILPQGGFFLPDHRAGLRQFLSLFIPASRTGLSALSARRL
jgi:hypothetical protein